MTADCDRAPGSTEGNGLLEPYEGRLSSTVLRGGGGGDAAPLPGDSGAGDLRPACSALRPRGRRPPQLTPPTNCAWAKHERKPVNSPGSSVPRRPESNRWSPQMPPTGAAACATPGGSAAPART